MEIQTTRFGALQVAAEEVVTFPRELLGIPGVTRFVAVRPAGQEGHFYWLQSADDPQVAFLVVDPNLFFKDYHVSIREETQQDLDLADATDGQLLVICNRVGDWITGNLQGPLVINTRTRVGQQVVLTEKKWTCRQPLVRLQESSSSSDQRDASGAMARAA